MNGRATVHQDAGERAGRLHRAMAAALALSGITLAGSVASPLAAAETGALRTWTAFVQAGVAEEAQMVVVGATRDWNWYRELRIGRLGGYWEASFGRWNSDHAPEGGSAWVTQLGLTPILRLHPQSWGGRWFVEAGIGANVLLPVYSSGTKQFSTTFNFGDHLAIGWQFGENAEHEFALRIQHFSNAGIKKPNPGENFLQIRYSRRF